MPLQPFRGVPQVDPGNYGMGALQNIQVAKQNALLNIGAQKKIDEYDANAPVREAKRGTELNEAAAADLHDGLKQAYTFLQLGNIDAIEQMAQAKLAANPNSPHAPVWQEMAENVRTDPKGLANQLSQMFADEEQENIPASIQEFNMLTKNLSPEEIQLAKEISLGLKPRAVGSSDITAMQAGIVNKLAETLQTLAKGKESGKQEAQIEAIAPKAEETREQEAIGDAPEAITKSYLSDEAANKSLNDITKVRGYLRQARTSGVAGKVASFWPGSTRKDLEGTYAKLKGRYTLEAIGDMKAQSATGATGFGQLNEKELDAIQSAVVRFDPDMSIEAQLQNMQELQRHIERQKAIAAVIKDYNMDLISEEEGSLTLEQQFQAIDNVISTGDNGAETGRVGDVGDREVYETNRGWFFRDTGEPYP